MQSDRAPSRSALSGRPLLGTRLDRDLFAGRDEQLRRIGRALADGLNCAVTGDPGAGRTSVLHRVLADLGEPQPLVRGHSVAGAGELLDRVIAACLTLDDPAGRLTAGSGDVIDRIHRLAGLIESRDRTVIAVDDVPPEAGMELFGRHRDELWAVPATWLVTVSTAHAAALLRPPADVFFEVRVDLPPLSEREAEVLLRNRIGDGIDLDLNRVVAAAQGNPRRLIELARGYSDADQGAIETLKERDARLAIRSAPARMLAAELEALGGASASDPALLERLGWTRSRAVQVLKELETAGLVVATDERSGAGRPRRIYRLTGER